MNCTNMKIVTDSSADVLTLEDIPFASAPLKIITAQKEYVDDAALDVPRMVDELSSYSDKSSTSCPSVGDWLTAFGDAESVFCVTVTSGLSGSYNSAEAAKRQYEELHPGRRVFVIDSLSAGPELKLIIEKLRELILGGKSFEEICTAITEYQKHTGLIFVLESLTNLANNGRVSRLAASAANILGIRIIGKASDKGDLEQLHKCRGEKKSLSTLVQLLHTLRFNGKKLRIGHCFNEQAVAKIKDMIRADFKNAEIESYALRGLCSFYAERGGILIGFEKE